jgi:hypothetical protein
MLFLYKVKSTQETSDKNTAQKIKEECIMLRVFLRVFVPKAPVLCPVFAGNEMAKLPVSGKKEGLLAWLGRPAKGILGKPASSNELVHFEKGKSDKGHMSQGDYQRLERKQAEQAHNRELKNLQFVDPKTHRQIPNPYRDRDSGYGSSGSGGSKSGPSNGGGSNSGGGSSSGGSSSGSSGTSMAPGGGGFLPGW